MALAVTKFRALSQAYYFTDTWKIRSNMTFDLGLRYEYTPPWFDANGTLMTRLSRSTTRRRTCRILACHPVLVRIGSGDVYEDTVLRFAGSALTFSASAPDSGDPGGARRPPRRQPDRRRQEQLRAANRLGVEPNATNGRSAPAPASSICRTPATRVSTWHATCRDGGATIRPAGTESDLPGSPFAGGSGTANVCGVPPPLVCLSDVYVLGNMPDRKTPYMVAVSVQRPARARQIDGARSRLPRLPQPSSGADVRLERDDSRHDRLGAEPEAVSGIHEGPGNRERRGGPLQFAGDEADAAARQGIVAARAAIRSRIRPTTAAASGRSMATRCFRRTASASTASGATSVFDVRHRFVVSILYELPFGEGKPYMQDGVGGAILGGWQISTIINKSSGFPRTIYTGTDASNTGGGQDRPNPTGISPVLQRRQSINNWFNKAAFVANPAGTWGTSARNTLIGPGITNVDASIIRNFSLMRGKSLQFRLEAFNVLNHPIWGDPSTTLNASTYDRSPPRESRCAKCKLGLKFVF